MEKKIDFLHDVPDFVPVRETEKDWIFRVFDRTRTTCKNYLSPNRRDFYLILYMDKGRGVFTFGLKTYYIDEPTIVFVHPSDIISWKNLATENSGYFCMIRKPFLDLNPSLRMLLDRYGFFQDKERSIVKLNREVEKINRFFERTEQEIISGGTDSLLAAGSVLQMILIETFRIGQFATAAKTDSGFGLVHHFLELLEKNISQIGKENAEPIVTTATAYAELLSVHPNYLNTVLKSHTGQSLGNHIKNRILEEAKVLLLYTDKSLLEISLLLGFSDQPNFSYFFKHKTGITPSKFRDSQQPEDNYHF